TAPSRRPGSPCRNESGVRRSWLAPATSWRRASNRRSIESAILLKAAASSTSSCGPRSAARAARSPPATTPETSRNRSSGPTIQRPSKSAPATAERAAADETARILASRSEERRVGREESARGQKYTEKQKA